MKIVAPIFPKVSPSSSSFNMSPHNPSNNMPTPPCAFESILTTSLSSDGGMLEVHSHLPPGITVGQGSFGRCLIAESFFAKGSILYRGYAALAQMAYLGKKKDVTTTSLSTSAATYSMTTTTLEAVAAAATTAAKTAANQRTMNNDEDGCAAWTESTSSSPSSSADNINEYMLHLYKDGTLIESFLLDEVNSVLDIFNPSEERRQVYGFDGFMNHSCSPNTHCPLLDRTPDDMSYDCYAIRDIFPGDEITCDYDTFEWEADGHQITACGCGSANCRKQILGFKNLTLKDKVRLMEYSETEIIDQFLAENPNVVIFESELPQAVGLVDSDPPAQLSLVALADFSKGQIIYTNRADKLSWQDLATKTFIEHVGKNRFILLDPEHHFIHRQDYIEHVGFDSFQDHSCDPNTCQLYHDDTTYTVRAARDIKAGEILTMDYAELKNQALNTDHIPSTTFKCESVMDAENAAYGCVPGVSMNLGGRSNRC